MATAYILSDLIIFIIYGVAWKWALMDMTNPCWNVWALSLPPHHWIAQAWAEPGICFKPDPSWVWIVMYVWPCGNGTVVPVQHVIAYSVSAAFRWTLQDFLGKISHHHQLQLCCDLNKSGVEISTKNCFFRCYLVSFLLEKNILECSWSFLITNLSSLVICDFKGLFQSKWFYDSMFVQLVESWLETSWLLPISTKFSFLITSGFAGYTVLKKVARWSFQASLFFFPFFFSWWWC